MTIETHPLEPFLPENARMLFLGSFPPPKARWSMEFFYPNWINDFWRIQGVIHFDDKDYFNAHNDPTIGENKVVKRFDKEKIVEFCMKEGLAFFDTARKVCRLKDNADDKFLEIVEGTDVFALLEKMPLCNTIITTGGKASEELQNYLNHSPALPHNEGETIPIPKVGECVHIPLSSISTHVKEMHARGNELLWYRMPSTSRAYPMKLEKKAEYYRQLWKVGK